MTTRQTRPDLPFYLSTEDLRFLLRKPSLDAVYKWIRRRKIMVFPRPADDLRPLARAGARLSGICAWAGAIWSRTGWRGGSASEKG